jgi:hypothetical protein
VPLAVFVLGFAWQERGRRGRWAWAAALGGAALLGAVLASPALRNTGRFVEVAQQVLQAKNDLGNLVTPLQGWQIFGIWPSGDFRFPPFAHQPLVFVLIGIAIVGALLGLIWLARRRPPAITLLVASSLIALIYLLRTGSPYANAKTMMIASTAVVLVSMLGATALRDAGRRLEGWALASVIAVGVLWTNGLAYHDANLAPRPRLDELKSIAARYAGHGPAWLDEWDELAAHFMRPVNVSNMPLVVPAAAPGFPPRNYTLAKYPIDVDEVLPAWLQRYPLLVLRRSPFASLPPANYRLVDRRRYYDVWQRVGAPNGTVLLHVSLGQPPQPNKTQPDRPARCSAIADAVRRAPANARLAYVERPRLPVLLPSLARRPMDWSVTFGDPTSVDLKGAGGTLLGAVTVARPGRYQVWAAGSIDRTLTFRVAGRKVGEISHQLGAQGDFTLVGTTTVPAGRVPIAVHRAPNGLTPGEGGQSRSLGPVVLTPVDSPPTVRYASPAAYRGLCGKRLDWVEIVR